MMRGPESSLMPPTGGGPSDLVRSVGAPVSWVKTAGGDIVTLSGFELLHRYKGSWNGRER